MSVFMRATRLLSTLMLLQARGRLTAQELADRFEVSVRTVYRDVDSLQRAGVPIYGDAGPTGGYQLVAGYTTRLTGMTEDEAGALFLSGAPGAAAELGLGAAMAAAQLKLHAALPASARERAGRILERFHLDPGSWYRNTQHLPHLPELAGAVWDQRRITVRYTRWEAPSDVTRSLDPHGLVIKAGSWYLVARSDQQMRTYRISEIKAIEVTEQHFNRSAGFDLAAYWEAYVSSFATRLYAGLATIRLSQAGRERFASQMDAHVVDAFHAGSSAPDAAGWVTATVPIESMAHAHAEFLRFGADLEVLRPVELRSRLVADAAALGRLYRENDLGGRIP
jgi:predicted DNA-binding transcriptional regulator YafY